MGYAVVAWLVDALLPVPSLFVSLPQLCYAVTGMPQKASFAVVPKSAPTNGDESQEEEEKKKKEEEERAANDLKTRKRVQTFLDVRLR